MLVFIAVISGRKAVDFELISHHPSNTNEATKHLY